MPTDTASLHGCDLPEFVKWCNNYLDRTVTKIEEIIDFRMKCYYPKPNIIPGEKVVFVDSNRYEETLLDSELDGRAELI